MPTRRVPARPEPPNLPEYALHCLTVGVDDTRYMPTLRGAFEFFRRNADGKYSDTTLMKLTRAWDIAQNLGRSVDSGTVNLPSLAFADAPYEYDEETEVKRGGLLGMMVVWPDKAIIAINRNARRGGLGTALFSEVRYYQPIELAMWVGRANQSGHMFCLSQGMFPSAMNGAGAVRYALGESTDE